jgi:DNA polymerase (family X)
VKLTHVERYVAAIAGALQPLCKRIEVAGSVRRQRPEVNDIDFVVLDADPVKFRERACLNGTVVKDGDDILIVRLRDGLQVDFYFAHGPKKELLETVPGNWGSVMLCRTGSKEHNVHLAKTALACGYKWRTMVGIVDSAGNVLASETEEAIFSALSLPYIEPERRER